MMRSVDLSPPADIKARIEAAVPGRVEFVPLGTCRRTGDEEFLMRIDCGEAGIKALYWQRLATVAETIGAALRGDDQ